MTYEIYIPIHTLDADTVPERVFGAAATEQAAWRVACEQVRAGDAYDRRLLLSQFRVRECKS